MYRGMWNRNNAMINSLGKGFVGGGKLPIGYASGRDKLCLSRASTASEAIAILKHRQQRGLHIASYMFVDILKRCLKQKDLTAAAEVHDCIIQSCMVTDQYVATTLLNIKCGRMQDARRALDGLEKSHRNVITLTVMIGEYEKSGRGVEAYRLFLQRNRESFTPNAITYISILSPSASAGALEWVKEGHGHAHRAGLDSDLHMGNALVHMFAKGGSIDDARLVFDRMEKRDVITWTVMTGAYAKSGCGAEAYRLFLQMQREGIKPNAITYPSILNASASEGALEWVKGVHSHALEAGLFTDLQVCNAHVHI